MQKTFKKILLVITFILLLNLTSCGLNYISTAKDINNLNDGFNIGLLDDEAEDVGFIISYPLSQEQYDVIVEKLKTLKYQKFPKNVQANVIFGRYTIVLYDNQGTNIYINRSAYYINKEGKTVKKWNDVTIIEEVIDILLSEKTSSPWLTED